MSVAMSRAAAARELGVTDRTLRQAIESELVDATVVGEGSARRYVLTADQLEAARALRLGQRGSRRRIAARRAVLDAAGDRDRRLAAHGLLTPAAAAEVLELTRSAVYTLIERGELVPVRLRGRVYFRRGELERWQAARRARLSAHRAADVFDLPYGGVLAAIEAGIVPAEWDGRAWVVDRHVFRAVLRRMARCHVAGCGRIVLAPGWCGVKGHARVGTGRPRKHCAGAGCGKRLARDTRGDLCQACLMRQRWSEPRWRARRVQQRHGKTKWFGGLGGRPRELTGGQQAEIQRRRAAGQSDRAIAVALATLMPGVSYGKVRRLPRPPELQKVRRNPPSARAGTLPEGTGSQPSLPGMEAA